MFLSKPSFRAVTLGYCQCLFCTVGSCHLKAKHLKFSMKCLLSQKCRARSKARLIEFISEIRFVSFLFLHWIFLIFKMPLFYKLNWTNLLCGLLFVLTISSHWIPLFFHTFLCRAGCRWVPVCSGLWSWENSFCLRVRHEDFKLQSGNTSTFVIVSAAPLFMWNPGHTRWVAWGSVPVGLWQYIWYFVHRFQRNTLDLQINICVFLC